MSFTPRQIKFVDTVDLLEKLVAEIVNRVEKPLIFVDLQGVNLPRDGSIGIMQALVPANLTVYLIDIHVLRGAAFETMTADGHTWKVILESSSYAKVFFDVRNDSDALYSHFDVRLGGFIDLQLLEFATRPGCKRARFVIGLAKCISESAILSWQEAQAWEQVKTNGVRQSAPEKGGTYEVFLRRPLSTAMQNYCAEDVLKMPLLLCVYAAMIAPHLASQVAKEAFCRVELSPSPEYHPYMNWQRIPSSPALVFPMTLVCSVHLATYCKTARTAPKPSMMPVVEAAAVPEAAIPAQAVSLDEIAKITQQMKQADIAAGPQASSELPVNGDNNDDDTNGPEYAPLVVPAGEYLGASYTDQGSYNDKDFAACSGDHSDWYGRCDY